MSIFPTDWPSFLWGLASGAVVILFSGFGSAAGSDLWSWVKKKVNRTPPEPKEVSQKFSPTLYAPGSCAWEPEIDVPEKERKGWEFYPHPETGGKCYRMANHGGRYTKEYLMVKPGAVAVNGT